MPTRTDTAGSSGESEVEQPVPPDPRDLAGEVAAAPQSDATQKRLRTFIEASVRAGAAAVPGLVAYLRSGDDVTTRWPWRFDDDRALEKIPTVRAAVIEALRRIDGDEARAALDELLWATQADEEGYLAALGLQERGADGWADPLLGLAGATDDETPDAEHLRPDMVRMAAEADPALAARRIEAEVPRGGANRRSALLLDGLRALPTSDAIALGTRLLDDDDVTRRTRADVVDALLGHDDVSVVRFLREEVERGHLAPDLARTAAERAAGSNAFTAEVRALARARRAGSGVQDALGRLRVRLEETEGLVDAAWPSDSPDAVKTRAKLRRYRDALGD